MGDDFNLYYSGSSGGGSELDYNIYEYIPFFRLLQSNIILNLFVILDVEVGS